MKFLKAYKIFEDLRDGLSKEQIEFLNGSTQGDWKYNQDTGFVDVSGSFDCGGKELKDFLGIRFGKVDGYFYCYTNKLTTLEGSPSEVTGNFDCSNNHLTTLEGSPSKVGGYFDCRDNQLTTLEGSPSEVRGYFDCSRNQLNTLKGLQTMVGRSFYCSYNKLTTLEGSPSRVNTNFNCNKNPLKSLKGAPEIIIGKLGLKNSYLNYNLKSFLGVISRNVPEVTELLLTHHFITPDVLIKQINKDPHFLIPISKGWNNPSFREKQEELTKRLPQKELEIIDALWSVGPYL
jgi:hypothetical protein